MNNQRELLQRIDAAVFRTITAEDWRRELATARRQKNSVADQIREKILALSLGKTESETIRKNS